MQEEREKIQKAKKAKLRKLQENTQLKDMHYAEVRSFKGWNDLEAYLKSKEFQNKSFTDKTKIFKECIMKIEREK